VVRPVAAHLRAREVLGWANILKFAHAFRWGCSYKRRELAQLLDQHGVCLTLVALPPQQALPMA
jgi:hypothetical protein